MGWETVVQGGRSQRTREGSCESGVGGRVKGRERREDLPTFLTIVAVEKPQKRMRQEVGPGPSFAHVGGVLTSGYTMSAVPAVFPCTCSQCLDSNLWTYLRFHSFYCEILLCVVFLCWF